MRHLVYRVQPLPASMLPLIWDFGQLNDEIERLYIAQIVNERFSKNEMGLGEEQIKLIVELLSASQKFMRYQNDECSFVSLRDVQRVLTVIQWFLSKYFLKNDHYYFRKIRIYMNLFDYYSIQTLDSFFLQYL